MSADELLNKVHAQTHIDEMFATGFNTVKHIRCTCCLTVFVAIDNRTRIVEQRNHLVTIFINNQRMDFTWWLKQV